MQLFISNRPFYEETYEETVSSSVPIRRVEIRLSMAMTEPSAPAPPPEPRIFEFVLDTGADYACVFPINLTDSCIPLSGPSGGWVENILMGGSIIVCPMRDVTLWLYRNVPDSYEVDLDRPYRIDLNGGVVVLPAPDPDVVNLVCPLLGMNPLLDAGLCIELNARARRFSVWLP